MNNQIVALIVHISIAVLQQPEKSITSLLKKTEDGTTVSFDNIPFSLEVRILDCQYGKHILRSNMTTRQAKQAQHTALNNKILCFLTLN